MHAGLFNSVNSQDIHKYIYAYIIVYYIQAEMH